MKKNSKFFYVFIAIMVLAVSTIGATYAYWAASTAGLSNEVQAKSTIYSISMDITPLYHDFSVIPMNDADALKALKNGCKDKYDRGACSAYTIYVYDYNPDLGFVSGVMDINTNNMQNLSYMMLRESDVYDEEKCSMVDGEIYCIGKEATPMGDGVGLSLGDSYNIVGTESTKFILLLWLSNLNQSQNDTDVGSFDAVVTIQAGSSGKIMGSISSAIKIEPGTDGDSNIDTDIDDEQTDIENGSLIEE